MSESTLEQFSCGSCKRNYTWKPQLAGKKVKCKCGTPINVPEALKPENTDLPADDEFGGFDLDALAQADAKAVDRTSNHADDIRIIPMAAPAVRARPIAAGGAGTPIGYQTGKTAYQLKREAELKGHLSDVKRDWIVPAVLLLVGLVLYIANFAYSAHLSAAGVGFVTVGLTVITVIKAVLLIVFALCVARPLGVSFGNPASAALKLAAIAVVSDGVTAWIGMWISAAAAGMGAQAITLPISAAIYWGLLIYLFSMDSGDSWLVVVLLTIVNRILLAIVMMVLAGMLLGTMGGGATATRFGAAAAKATQESSTAQYIADLKDYKQWKEARAYIADGHQAVLKETVDGMYAAGSPEIGFEVSKDINGHGGPVALYVHLPESKEKRKKILQLRHDYFKSLGLQRGDEDLIDDPSEDYLTIGVN